VGTLEKTSGKEVTFRFKNRQRKEKGFKKIKFYGWYDKHIVAIFFVIFYF